MTTTRKGWGDEAACRNAPDPDIFYPLPRDPQSVKLARAYCRRCPVQTECGRYARGSGDAHAILAGTTPEQRRKSRLPLLHRTTPTRKDTSHG